MQQRRVERPLDPLKTGWIVAARVGSPAEPHVLAVLHTRYEAQSRRMELTRATITAVETIPGGGLGELVDRIEAATRAARRADGRAGVAVPVCVTRSPEARHMLLERVDEAVPALISKAVKDDYALPFRLLGRLSLLSGMSAMLPRQQVGVSIPASDDPRRMSAAKVREVLAKAQAKPAALDDEELALGGSVDDDAALTMALGCWYAASETPDPWRKDASWGRGYRQPA